MSTVDRSQTERIRRIRAKLQADRRLTDPTVREEGTAATTDQSTRVNRTLGQATYYRLNAIGAVVEESCCPPLT